MYHRKKDTYRPLSMRGTWKDSTACFCRTTNKVGLSNPCDNTSTDTRTPSIWNPKRGDTDNVSHTETRNHCCRVTLRTHLIPGDSVIESIDGLVFTCNRVIICHIKLCIFLDHIFGLPHRPAAAISELGHAQPEQECQSRSDAARSRSIAVFMSRFPAAPQHHFVRARLPFSWPLIPDVILACGAITSETTPPHSALITRKLPRFTVPYPADDNGSCVLAS